MEKGRSFMAQDPETSISPDEIVIETSDDHGGAMSTDSTPLEVSVPGKTVNAIANPIGFMRQMDPRKARDMQQRRDNLVMQRELSAIDSKLNDFRF